MMTLISSPDEVPKPEEIVQNHGHQQRLTMRSIKIVADGALGSYGAALHEPYSDNPSTSGFLLSPPETLEALVRKGFENKHQVNVHCIGDKANSVILSIYQDVLKTYDAGQTRPRIEHAQIMTWDDVKLIGKLGVIPSVQPTHATSDMWVAEARLGPDRLKGAYAYRTLLDTSSTSHIALGSDFPIEGIDPLLGFYAAITRLSVDGSSPNGTSGWYPNEALTRTQALQGMTLSAAYSSFMEDQTGSLEVGKKADFVILDQDIMTIPADKILDTKVIATVVDGEVVFGKIKLKSQWRNLLANFKSMMARIVGLYF